MITRLTWMGTFGVAACAEPPCVELVEGQWRASGECNGDEEAIGTLRLGEDRCTFTIDGWVPADPWSPMSGRVEGSEITWTDGATSEYGVTTDGTHIWIGCDKCSCMVELVE